jgi:nucleotide-binding universal stress UspA family protein
MTIKTILVPISTAETSKSTLQVATQMARRFGAHIDALHVQADPRGLVPYTGEGMDGSMIEEIMEVTEREGNERAASSKAFFEEFCASNGLEVTQNPVVGQSATISWSTEVGR